MLERHRRRIISIAAGSLAAAFVLASASAASASPYLDQFSTVTSLTSTVPMNPMDVNPYGIVTVPRSTGDLVAGDLLVSNFNNAKNQQGTGTTIDQITPSGTATLFAHIDATHLPGACPGGVGLTTALTALRSGFVIVGSLPTTDGTSATAKAGCLIVLNKHGHVVETIAGHDINGPWDMTAVDNGNSATLFVTNVLNHTVAANGKVVDKGTVVRIQLRINRGMPATPVDTHVIARGFPEKTDPNALVIGPTGVGFGVGQWAGTLYVADTAANRIAAIPNAMTRMNAANHGGATVTNGGALDGPLGLSVAPNGDIITANGGDGNLVETTPGGSQVAHPTVDPAGAGVLFGLVAAPNGVFFVDDGDNTFRLFH
jgi:hypothetical protein